MTTKEYLRTALQPYKSTKLIDIPMPNAPTSGGTVNGDQRFPSIKDFCEYILKYGTEGKQAPTGNLWINGANLGAYEYYFVNSSFSYTEPNPVDVNIYSSTDSNKCFFFVCNGNLTVSAPSVLAGTSVEVSGVKQLGKKIHCIYVKGNFTNGTSTSTGASFKSVYGRGSPSTDVITEPIVLMPTPAGQYLYPRTANVTYYNGGNPILAPTLTAGTFAISSGTDGYPRTSTPEYTDGIMFLGTGGSGATSSDYYLSQGGAGLPPTAWGGGGGGGGSFGRVSDDAAPNYRSTYGTNASSTESSAKGGTVYHDTMGGAGIVHGYNIEDDAYFTEATTGVTGGIVVIFVTGVMANIQVRTPGATPPIVGYPDYITGGGSSGSGPIFVMAQSVVNCGYTANTGFEDGGGRGGYGTVIEFTGPSF